MWFFLSDAFLSIVAHRDHPDDLMVRARLPGDIERVFPAAEVLTTPHADYRFRAVIPRQTVAQAMADHVLRIEYDNFKNSVRDHARHDAYLDVWSAMARAQRRI